MREATNPTPSLQESKLEDTSMVKESGAAQEAPVRRRDLVTPAPAGERPLSNAREE